MRPYVLMLQGAFAFAVMGALTHAARDYCDWQMIALSRSLVALILAGLLAWQEGSPVLFLRPWSLWVRSLAGSASVMFNFYALTRLPVADALTLTNMFPLWIAVLSWPVLGKMPERDVWLGVLCGLAGVVLMQQPYLAEGNIGTLAAVSGSVTSAVALIGLHRLRHLKPNSIVVHFSSVSVMTVIGLMLVVPSERSMTGQLTGSWHPLVLLLGVGVSATTGQLFLTRAFAAGAPARVSVVGLSQVGFALILELLFFSREFHWHSLPGMLLVIGPTGWLMLRGHVSRANSDEPAVDGASESPRTTVAPGPSDVSEQPLHSR